MICNTDFKYGSNLAIENVKPRFDGSSCMVLVYDPCLHRMTKVCYNEPQNVALAIFNYWRQVETIVKIFDSNITN